MARTVIGLFDEFSQAEKAIKELENAGVPKDNISIVANNANNSLDSYRADAPADLGYDNKPLPPTGVGADTGAVVGGVGGVLLGLGLLAIPGLGPLAAAGWLVAGLTGAGVGAAAGAVTGGIMESLEHAGVPAEHAGYYAEGVRRGGTLVAVHTEDDMVDHVIDILNSNGAVDINQRAADYEAAGYTGYDPKAEPYTVDQVTRERARVQAAPTPAAPINANTAPVQSAFNTSNPAQPVNQNADGMTFSVVEEDLQVGKRQVDRGGVRVYSRISERPVEETVQLHEEHVNVERRPVNRPATGAEFDSFKEGVIEVKETAEEAVVAKQARVIEEVVINKEASDRTETIHETVRRTDVEVEQLEAHAGRRDDYNGYTDDFRENYRNNYSSLGGAYEQYEPAYQYGFERAADPRYRGRQWNDIEPELQRDWETRQPGTWNRFTNSVRYAWDKATGSQRGGIQTGGHALDGTPDTRGITEKIADTVTGDRIDDKTGKPV